MPVMAPERNASDRPASPPRPPGPCARWRGPRSACPQSPRGPTARRRSGSRPPEARPAGRPARSGSPRRRCRWRCTACSDRPARLLNGGGDLLHPGVAGDARISDMVWTMPYSTASAPAPITNNRTELISFIAPLRACMRREDLGRHCGRASRTPCSCAFPQLVPGPHVAARERLGSLLRFRGATQPARRGAVHAAAGGSVAPERGRGGMSGGGRQSPPAGRL